MRGGPVRRLVAGIGLLALVPIGYLLVRGELSVPDAAIRAAITLAAVIAVSRLAGWGFTLLAGSIEASDWDGTDRRRRRET